MEPKEDDLRKLLELLKSAYATADLCAQKLQAMEAVLKQHPEVDQEYQKSLSHVKRQSGSVATPAAFEALEKSLFRQ